LEGKSRTIDLPRIKDCPFPPPIYTPALCSPSQQQPKLKRSSRLFSGRVKVTTEEDMKNKQQGNVEKKQQRAPRFAPELDGLHCFETLVSY
ncbi:hypothetical protein V6Z11_D08G126600, partial [Gossypium hirsutum]